MKRSKILACFLTVLIFTAFSVTLSADISVNGSYMFVLGTEIPSNAGGYGSSVILSEEEAKALLPNDVSYGNLAALLRAGSALDLLGYMKKYGVDEDTAYALTQSALDILTGASSHTEEIAGLSSSQRKYLAAVLKAGYDETPVPTDVTLSGRSSVLRQDAQGNYVSEIMNFESVMGGILRFTDLSEGVKLYTLSGDEAPYLISGQSFYFLSEKPFDLSLLTAEHIYHIPEIIVSYHENSESSPLVTAVMSPEKTAKNTLAVSFVKNPDTGDSDHSVTAYAFTGAISVLILAVKLRHGRKHLKIGAVGH